MGEFAAAVRLYCDQVKQDELPSAIRAQALAILQAIIERSPVGDPKRWKINRAYAMSLEHTSRVNAAQRRANGGRLKKGQKKSASALIEFTTKEGKHVRFRQRGWAAKNYTGGRFRGNWQVTFNTPATGTVERIDKTGNATLAAGSTVLSTLDIDSVTSIWYTNNVAYAKRLEDGWSGQAPAGILAVVAAAYIARQSL